MKTTTQPQTLKTVSTLLITLFCLMSVRSFAQGVGISESSITPDASSILELRSNSKGFILPRLATGSISSPVRGLLIYNGTTDGNLLSFYNGSWITLAPLASPTFTGTVTIPTPFTLGATSVTSTGTQLNYLNAATGTTGTASTNLVFSASPTFTGTVTIPTPFTLGATSVTSTGTQLNYLSSATGTTGTATSNVVFSDNPAFAGFSSSGAVVNINANSNFATNINTGTSTGAVSIGNSAAGGITQNVGTGNFTLNGAAGSTYSIGASTVAGTIDIGGTAQTGTLSLGVSTAAQTVSIASTVNTGAQIINIANGNTGANSTVNILSGTGTAGAGSINIGDNQQVSTIDIGNVTPAAARTTTIAGQTSAVVDQINIGTGAATVAAGKTINIGTTAPTGAGTNLITIGSSSTTARHGVRFGTSRVVKNYSTAPTTGGAVVLTAAQVLDAGIYVINASVTVTFPTAALLIAAMPNPQVGDVINFAIASTGNFTPTIAVGAGGTIGSQATGVARVTRYLSIRLTNVTGGAEAYTIY